MSHAVTYWKSTDDVACGRYETSTVTDQSKGVGAVFSPPAARALSRKLFCGLTIALRVTTYSCATMVHHGYGHGTMCMEKKLKPHGLYFIGY